MRKILYITFNDAPSGIYAGQVIDVCTFWKEKMNYDVSLLAFISIRGFRENKRKIKSLFPEAFVLPMFPKMRNWKLNSFLLGRKLRKIKPDVIVARGPFATFLAQQCAKEKKIVFDARGAYIAELNEYNVVPDEKIKKEIFEIEKAAVLKSDFRLAVSNELVKYWEMEFGYNSGSHVVIPCTLNNKIFETVFTKEEISKTRKRLGANEGDVLLVYSGSSAEWQSFEAMDKAICKLLSAQKNLRVVLLVKNFPENAQLLKDFSDRVKKMWVKPEEVNEILQACDYGWLVREKSVTNAVASPVKFAEYLSAGLSVIISEGLGDYSEFVKINLAGIIFNENNIDSLKAISSEEKLRLISLAHQNFRKEIFVDNYKKLLQ